MRIERKRHAMNLPQRFFQMLVRPSWIPCAHALARAGLVGTCRAVRLAGCVAFGLAFLLGVAGAEASSGGFLQQQVADGKAANAEDLRDMQSAAVSTKGVSKRAPCVDGEALSQGLSYSCKDIDLLATVFENDMPGFPCTRGTCFNDVWGWTDPETGVEYALLARHDGIAFIDLRNPEAPRFLGMMPSTPGTQSSIWRDVKVVNDHAVVVADAVGEHGMQIFDLAQLRDVTNPPATFEPTALYDAVGSAHNVVVNDEKDHVYVVGAQGQPQTPSEFYCFARAHIVDLSDPANPAFAGCVANDFNRGYTHDAQCVRYRGPDASHVGKDICIGFEGIGGTFTDVTDAAAPKEISLFEYPNVHYVHQGWLTEDHRYLFVNDELDEIGSPSNPGTRTLIYDVQDLDDPVLLDEWHGPTPAIDHNLYIHGDKVYEANYAAGLRVLDISYDDELSPETVREVAHFDTYTLSDDANFVGAWSSYPFFESGIVLVSDMFAGLYVVKPTWPRSVTSAESAESEELPAEVMLLGNYPNPFNPETTIRYALPERSPVRLSVYDLAGREVAALVDGVQPAGEHAARFDGSDLPSGSYVYRLQVGEEVETRTMTLVK